MLVARTLGTEATALMAHRCRGRLAWIKRQDLAVVRRSAGHSGCYEFAGVCWENRLAARLLRVAAAMKEGANCPQIRQSETGEPTGSVSVWRKIVMRAAKAQSGR